MVELLYFFATTGLAIGVVSWFVLSIAVACCADAKGRSWFGWFLISVLISPFFSVLMLIAVPDLKARAQIEALLSAVKAQQAVPPLPVVGMKAA